MIFGWNARRFGMRICMKGMACLAWMFALAIAQGTLAAYPTLSFVDRVRAQEAVERVYYNHRIWPKENPGPKPPFEQMISRAQIEAKVEDYLKKSVALEKFWQRPITAEQLQAEMDRMAKQTKDPDTLKELFAALDNDPYLIAECLALPILADRFMREQYANYKLLHALSFETSLKGKIAVPVLCEAEKSYEMPFIFETSNSEGWLSTSRGANVPSPRWGHTAVWTGMEMIIWGGDGYGYEQDNNTGGAYIPSTDSWIPTSTGANVPDGREGHTAVWTGCEMIVWGGFCYGQETNYFLSTGGRYNPSTDSWIPASIGSNVPDARAYHTAIWTGTEMIIWGGLGGIWNWYLSTGGRYNPSTDSWIPTSIGENVPSERDGHTAVWTGTEMLIWGGGGVGDSISGPASGGRYNPPTDSWITTSTGADTPGFRMDHTAVWAGTEMIVWGGGYAMGANFYPFSSGGQYSPAKDSWVATSMGMNVPSTRSGHTAVWTEFEMIVWGGQDADYHLLDDGGCYNPMTDSWDSTSIGPNVPSARFGHTAVWTGRAMIIWGGLDESGYHNDGGIYFPESPHTRPVSPP